MCQHGTGFRPGGPGGFTGTRCGCGCGHGFRRMFSAQEEREYLENYQDQLKKELAGVEERIKEWEGK